jgi:hypothetical protein
VHIGRRVPVVVATALAVTLVGGVAYAVASHPTTAKACVTSGGALRLSTAGKCASGQQPITLGSQGPKGDTGATGPRGAKGATGAQGPQGDVGPAGDASRVNFTQTLPETSATHALATAGPVTLIAACNGTAGATTSLTLTVTGGTDVLSFTASDVASDNGVTLPATITSGATVSLGSAALPVISTTDSRSDVVSIVVSSASGSEVSGTLAVTTSTSASAPACTVNGTLAAA